jgi:Xaa-Pro aminopeptidase
VTVDQELAQKERRVSEFLHRENLDGLLLSKHGNFAWITCGGSNHVAVNADVGAANALITHSGKWIICDNIEARRIMEEEVAGLGFSCQSFDWFDDGVADALQRVAPGARIASDTGRAGTHNVEARLGALRASLLPDEVERYRRLGAIAAAAMTEACRRVEPGMTEYGVAGLLGGEVMARGAFPVVLLIAADERAFTYRHPIPTDNRVRAHIMLVLCARRWGLIVSMTRLAHFGALPAELRRKHDAVMRVDATLVAATIPGARVGDVFDRAVAAYAAAGFPDEWRLHHQGGPTGYVGREFRATSKSGQMVVESQAFAWNPSIAGTKSEDTIVAGPTGPEVLSATPELPASQIESAGRILLRPDIVVR